MNQLHSSITHAITHVEPQTAYLKVFRCGLSLHCDLLCTAQICKNIKQFLPFPGRIPFDIGIAEEVFCLISSDVAMCLHGLKAFRTGVIAVLFAGLTEWRRVQQQTNKSLDDVSWLVIHGRYLGWAVRSAPRACLSIGVLLPNVPMPWSTALQLGS